METRINKTERVKQLRDAEVKKPKLWSALQGAERHAKSMARAADAEYRDCSCCGAQREAESFAWKHNLGSLPGALMPNPILFA